MKRIIGEIEAHDVEGIIECLSNGVNPNDLYNNVPLIYELTSEYGRTSRFKDCVKAFVDQGLNFDDEALLAVLLDEQARLADCLMDNPAIINRKYTLRCAFTPLFEVTLLHICAEFNQVACAKLLIESGADINAKAGVDDFGFGGQTPIFHTVNQHRAYGLEVAHLLLERSCNLSLTIKGLIWGKGYEWETFIPAVNPLSYAMMGLLPQFQRTEQDTYKIISLLFHARYGISYEPKNIPNRYLSS
ncbi:Ankyrin repeat-containing protein [Pedobacter soli]|uniref:Ankyrin repeat-containing protein n=1 Tax=Pedobacter soli TaxID=390242 RepID=A0A1G6LNQ0_9SPHI|nr:Ankyrin repeat-containing protein [Pedobacter soli]